MTVCLKASGQFINTQLDNIDILQYDFHIQINDSTNVIQGETHVKFVIKKTTEKLDLDFKNQHNNGLGMKVLNLFNNQGKNLKYKHTNDHLIIDLKPIPKPQDTVSIIIKYSGIPEDGLYIKENKYGQRTFFGDNWPNRARYWLPVIDHPSDKALVTWHITAPKHYNIVASGKLFRKISGLKYDQYEFATKVPLPTKVMVFAAADFNIKYYDKLYLSNKCISVSSWIYQKSPLDGFDDYKCALKILKYYDSLIGPYAFEKLANVQSNTRFGGMENAGNIFYDEDTVDGSKSVENLVAHEIAHQWFGNAVSEEKWQDIWLSEGFATYLTDLYVAYFYGQKKFKERLNKERQKIRRYNRFTTHPIVYEEKQNLFKLLNPNSYEKGAWVLHLLRQKVGDRDFFKILRGFYQQYYLKNASTKDFIVLAEKISGQKLDWFFKQWLYTPGIPQLKFFHQYDTKTHTVKLQIIQKGELYKLDITVLLTNGKDSIYKNIQLNNVQQTYEFKLPAKMHSGQIQLIIDPDINLLFESLN